MHSVLSSQSQSKYADKKNPKTPTFPGLLKSKAVKKALLCNIMKLLMFQNGELSCWSIALWVKLSFVEIQDSCCALREKMFHPISIKMLKLMLIRGLSDCMKDITHTGRQSFSAFNTPFITPVSCTRKQLLFRDTI